MCFKKLRGIFSKPKPKQIVAEKEESWQRKWWHLPFRAVKTSRGGLNMPKYQPCPQCSARSKRQEKTLNGANYFCRSHKSFFVRA